MSEKEQTYRAYRYLGGSTKGTEIDCASDRESVFNTAELDAREILEELNRKAAEEPFVPGLSTSEPCHTISDENAQIIEIRRDGDGILMYYYDVC